MEIKRVNPGRRRFLTRSTTLVGVAGCAGAAVPFVTSLNPSAKAVAAGAPITIDTSRLAPGMLLGPMPAWRGKPVFVLRRNEEILADLRVNTGHLVDPESSNTDQQPEYARNGYRSIRPDISVLVGICTHLGCVPLFNPDRQPQDYDPNWRGGFFCPCHGSMFDLAGRVYKGVPAPNNLVVPPHYFMSESVVVVGVEEGET